MKKVLLHASTASMIYQFNMNNIELLENLGYRVDVACNFGAGNTVSEKELEKFRKILENKNIRIFETVSLRNILPLRNIVNAYKLLKKLAMTEHYELVHTQSPIGGVVCRLAFRKARKKGTKVIYQAHGFHFYNGCPLKNWVLFYPIEKLCSYFTDVLITINKEDYQRAKSQFYAKRTEYIPGVGIDLKKFCLNADQSDKPLRFDADNILGSVKKVYEGIRKKLGICSNEKVLIYIAELNKNKNQMSLIDMLAEILKMRDDVKLILVGQGNYKKQIEQKAKSLNVMENLILTGYRCDVRELLFSADICVPSSIREGLGLNVLEAMACGVPVVAYDNRGHRSIIRDGINGCLIKNGDYKAMAEKVNAILEDVGLAHEIAKCALADIQRYSLENVLCMMRDIYM